MMAYACQNHAFTLFLSLLHKFPYALIHYCTGLLKEGVLLVLSLRLLYAISIRVPFMHAPISYMLVASINGALLDTLQYTKIIMKRYLLHTLICKL
jgi:hypothetical protein